MTHAPIVDPFSLPSLLVQTRVNGNQLGTATGFVIINDGRPYLVTNLHVVTGRDTETNAVLSPTGGIPDSILIFHHSAMVQAGNAGVWAFSEEALYEDGEPRWLAHPQKCIKDMERPSEYDVDLALLPLANCDPEVVRTHPVDLNWANTDVHVAPGLPVSIVGYPFGRPGAALFPIWKTGHVASDPDAHWASRYFLVDATTRPGMSGAPVIFRSPGIYQRGDGAITFGNANRFMGVYSGRIQDGSEIGIVWQPQLIGEIVAQAVG